MSGPPHGRWVPGNDWTGLSDAPAARAPTVSVVITHHEQPDGLARTLAALSRQSYPADRLEIVVSDDGSELAPRLPEGVRLVRQPRHGPRRAAARNRGIAAASGELICLLDADTTPEPEYVAHLTRLIALAPEAVCVGRRRHADLTQVPVSEPIEVAGPRHELASPSWLEEGYCASANLRHADPRSFRLMISAVLAASRWFLADTGGFDESFDAYGGEDWEWAYRAWLNGAVFAHVPDAVAWHDGPDWQGRQHDGAGRAEKNAEAIRLSRLIDVPGHRARGLALARAEATVRLDPSIGPQAAYLTVDSVLSALPDARVVLDDAQRAAVGPDARIAPAPSPSEPLTALMIDVAAGLSVDGPNLARLCRELLDADVGSCRISDARGTLMTLTSSRQRARIGRWGPEAALAHREIAPDWVRRLDPVPDVEAYLGGWTRSGAGAQK